MSSDAQHCAKCGQPMTRGFVFEGTILSWFEGDPEKAMLGGAKPPAAAAGVPTAAFRCRACGHLEFFAGPEYGPR